MYSSTSEKNSGVNKGDNFKNKSRKKHVNVVKRNNQKKNKSKAKNNGITKEDEQESKANSLENSALSLSEQQQQQYQHQHQIHWRNKTSLQWDFSEDHYAQCTEEEEARHVFSYLRFGEDLGELWSYDHFVSLTPRQESP